MTKNVELDRIDRKILMLLQANARISNLELAERVGLSPTPCARRVRMLEEKGVITDYAAHLDLARFGKGFSAFASVHLDSHAPAVTEAFERRILELPEVLEAYTVTGTSEYILKIATEDLHAYNNLQRQKLLMIPHVLTIDSIFILHQVKRGTPVSL
jgi:Lrp/AsnC family transcriptional regulator, leucine-responsive regulatory protein